MKMNTIYEQFKSFLKYSSESSPSLYDHLIKILCFIHIEAPKEPYQNFESISKHIKEFSSNKTIQDQDDNLNPKHKLYKFPKPNEFVLKNIEKLHSIPSLFGGKQYFSINANILALGGIIFDEYEVLTLQVAFLTLLKLTESESIRFWGKVLGIEKDYYIAEIKITDTSKATENFEQNFNNVSNKEQGFYEYWYFNDPEDPSWVKLEGLDSVKVEQAENIKCILNGSPKKAFRAGLSFEGSEEQYLRALLEIISVATIVEHKSNNENILESHSSSRSLSQSIESLGASPSDLDSWLYTRELGHAPGNIKSRTESSESLDRSASVSASVEGSMPLDTRTLKSDNINGYPNWIVRKVPKEKCSKTAESKVVYVLKSLAWPGATVIFDGDETTCIYIGTGIRASKDIINNLIPPNIMSEPDEPDEQFEPQPQSASDSEKESHIE